MLASNPLFKFSWTNTTHLVVSNASIPAWEWTADFWMVKDLDSDSSYPFYIGPEKDKHDFLSTIPGIQYPAVTFEVYHNSIKSSVYLECYMRNFNDCR